MSSLLSNFFGKKEVRALGIDVGTSAIKIVELYTENGRVHLETYGSIALGPYADIEIGKATNLPLDKIQEALHKVISDSGAVAQEAGVAIPISSSLVSVIRIPKVSEKQLEQIIPMEARKYIPASLDEVTLDWSVMETQADIPVSAQKVESERTEESSEDTSAQEVESEQGQEAKEENSGPPQQQQGKEGAEQIDVLLAAIHNESIERYQQLIQDTSLEVSFYEIEIFSTLRALSPISGNAPMAIVDIGARSSKVYIIEQGVVRSSHTVNHGSQDITRVVSHALNISEEEAEMVKRDIGTGGTHPHVAEAVNGVLDRLFSEVSRLIGAYEEKRSRSMEKVVLSGGGSALKGIKTEAQEKLSENVVLAQPFDRVKSQPFMKETLSHIGPEFTTALGIALRAVGVEE